VNTIRTHRRGCDRLLPEGDAIGGIQRLGPIGASGSLFGVWECRGQPAYRQKESPAGGPGFSHTRLEF
jgi:hypothetical protein